MKKIIAVIILLAMALAALVACGGAEFDATKNITVIGREEGSGTRSAFRSIVKIAGAEPQDALAMTSTAAVLTEVKGNPAAIAYESLGYVTNEVKTLKIDGSEATVANIKSGDYKISRPLSVVYQDSVLGDAAAKAFFEFLKSSQAQAIITEEGYVSVADGAAAYEPDGALAGVINISGSTSLEPLMGVLEEEFRKLQPEIKINIAGGGSGAGYENAENGVSEFGMISEEFNASRAENCVYYIVAKDGIAVIVHKDNPLDNITMDQLRAIYDADAENPAGVWSDLIK